jgi:hypothetical protein
MPNDGRTNAWHSSMGPQMIDPQEFGGLQAEVVNQRRDLERMSRALEDMARAMHAMQDQLAEARGGWKVLLMVGGASATAGAGLVQLVSWFVSSVRGP